MNDGQAYLDDDIILTPLLPPEKPKRILCSGCGQPIGTRRTYHSLDCKFRRDERNGKSNPQHNFRTKYRKSVNVENTLFDISGTLILNEQLTDLKSIGCRAGEVMFLTEN